MHTPYPICFIIRILTIWKDVRVYQRNIYEKCTLLRVDLVKGLMNQYPVTCIGVAVRCEDTSA